MLGFGLLLVLAVVLAAFFTDRYFRARTRSLRAAGLYPPAGQGSDSDVLRLAEGGHKIEAIKLYREIHGRGLKEAKEAVEDLLAGRLVRRPTALRETDADVLRLAEAGRKIEAIKRYREIRGVGLKEAKQAVEELAAEAVDGRPGPIEP